MESAAQHAVLLQVIAWEWKTNNLGATETKSHPGSGECPSSEYSPFLSTQQCHPQTQKERKHQHQHGAF